MVFRKRRSTSFSKDESKTSADVPVERSNGNRNWFDQSKRDIRKVERTKKRKEKKGKMPSSHLQSQRLIGGKVFFHFYQIFKRNSVKNIRQIGLRLKICFGMYSYCCERVA